MRWHNVMVSDLGGSIACPICWYEIILNPKVLKEQVTSS